MIGLLIHKNHGDINQLLKDSRNIFKETYLLDNFKYEDKTILLIFEKDIKSIDISRFDFVENVFHKQYTEYLDVAQCTSRFGFHTDHYIPLQRTGDRAVDKKAMQDLESTYALDDINVVLDSDEPTFITRDSYVAQLEAIKKSLEKDLTSMSIQDLAKAYDLAKTHYDVITIACLIYTWKYGKPVSKSGHSYNYKPEQYWSESFFGKPDFHVLHDMQYYFDEFPSMQKQWVKSLKTRCRNIIKEELGLFRITGFIQFLRNKHVEESVSMLDEYRKPEEDSEEEYSYPIPLSTKNFPMIDIDDSEIPFSLSIAIPLSSILAFAQLSTNFI